MRCWNFRIAEINILGHHLDPCIKRLLHHILQCFRLAMTNNEAADAEADRLLNLVAR